MREQCLVNGYYRETKGKRTRVEAYYRRTPKRGSSSGTVKPPAPLTKKTPSPPLYPAPESSPANSASAEEERVCSLFKVGQAFVWKGATYCVVMVGKPSSKEFGGEPKTDIFVRVQPIGGGTIEEIKISFKKSNAEFIENKLTLERMKIIVPDMLRRKEIIDGLSGILKSKVTSRDLVSGKPNIKIGWRLDFMDRPSGKLTFPFDFNQQESVETYSGSNLAAEKRDAKVCGKIVENSGVANHILKSDNIGTLQDAINEMQPIEQYASEHRKIYTCLKGVNLRIDQEGELKAETRPLAFYVSYHIKKDGSVQPVVHTGHFLQFSSGPLKTELVQNLGGNDAKHLSSFANLAIRSPIIW